MTGYFASAGFTHGLKAPPGTAEATGLSQPSLLTEETPKIQSSTRMWSSLTLHMDGRTAGVPWTGIEFPVAFGRAGLHLTPRFGFRSGSTADCCH